jgi:hypothetical protein
MILWRRRISAKLAPNRAARSRSRHRTPVYAIEDHFEDLWRSQRFKRDGPREGRLAQKTIEDYENKAKAFGLFDASSQPPPVSSSAFLDARLRVATPAKLEARAGSFECSITYSSECRSNLNQRGCSLEILC